MCEVENHMIVDSYWPKISYEEPEKTSNPGYREITTGEFVPEEDAFFYAMEQFVETVPEGFYEIKWTNEFKKEIVEWFYSGNWIKED